MILGPKMDEVTGDSKILQEEELRDRYSSPNVIRIMKSGRMRREGDVKRMGQRRGVYRLSVEKPEGKRPLGIPRRRWVIEVKVDLEAVG
jgi:hypothetical protein